MAAGARAAIIYNNASGNFPGTLQYASNWIPALSIAQADGQTLKALLPTTGTVVNAFDSNAKATNFWTALRWPRHTSPALSPSRR